MIGKCNKTRIKMQLSDYDGFFFQVIKDGSFETIGNYISSPGMPYLSYAENKAYVRRACDKEDISCLICTKELSEMDELKASDKGIAIADNPRIAFNRFYNWLFSQKKCEPKIVKTDLIYAREYKKSQIGEGTRIHDTAVISENGVVIGANCSIEEYVVIREGVSIGDNVTIRTGAVIGVPSNIVVRDGSGQFPILQLGEVVIHNNVVVGCHVHISRGSFPYEYTEIGENTTIDNNTEIAHNVKIGRNCIITGQTQVCGNSILEDNTRLNPMAIVSNRIHVSEGCTIDIGSVVVNNLKKNERVAGNFAIPHDKFLLWHRKKLRKQ